MKIYSMTATFGKLEHETLTLDPELNVLCAPNEWGKSTWCAFLIAMLFGMDTRAKTTKTALAEKERYAPWSGSPMEGRIDLNWQGRDITIERRTKGRIPLGEFRAYETATGIDIPELTGSNCGQQLLGVEQSVFRRTGFIRLADLPVTQDPALRNRLNALVSTGDESGDGAQLAKSLRDLKNECRYNRSGLLPQAIQTRDTLSRNLAEWEELNDQSLRLRERQAELEQKLADLENHRAALRYRAAQADERRVAEAQILRDGSIERMDAMEAACADLPPRELVEGKCTLLRELSRKWSDLQLELRVQADEPRKPEVPEVFRDLTPEDAVSQAQQDALRLRGANGKGWLFLMILGMFCLVSAGALASVKLYVVAAVDLAIGLGGFILGIRSRMLDEKLVNTMISRYGTLDTNRWQAMAETYGAIQRNYEQELSRYRANRTVLDGKLDNLQKQRASLCGDQTPEEMLHTWQQSLEKWDAFYSSRREAMAAEEHLETVLAMAKHSDPPERPDYLTLSREETEAQLADTHDRLRQLRSRADQYLSRMDTIGEAEDLRRRLDQAEDRVRALEKVYTALSIAQETLEAASAELQRRFAPRITAQAQEFLSRMTGGRYDRLVIASDFSLRSGARQEDTLHDALWRSDGTIDQLYLALRLAVSEELSPHAPLILDDALVRFDDRRMEAAMQLLQDLSKQKQILLFTCQQREKQILEQKNNPLSTESELSVE